MMRAPGSIRKRICVTLKAMCLFWVFLSLLLFVWDAFTWLRIDEWNPVTMRAFVGGDPLTWFGGWLAAPESWLGAHRVVTWLMDHSLALLLLIFGVLAGVMGTAYDKGK